MVEHDADPGILQDIADPPRRVVRGYRQVGRPGLQDPEDTEHERKRTLGEDPHDLARAHAARP